MTTLSSQHHSFDIALASRYGVECAILIHHFQHWIRINQFKKRNIRDGRCWTYQSRKDIQAHFPYWDYNEVRRLCEKLVAFGVLITANYNKSPIDKTLWYAFVDEKAFQVDWEFSKNVYERQNCHTKGKIATPIPDTKTTNTKTNKREVGPRSLEPQEESSAKAEPSADADHLCEFFLKSIKKRCPDLKPPNLDKWRSCIDLLLRVDKRDLEKTKRLIEWAESHKHWRSACLSPEKLRKVYDEMSIQMDSEAKNRQVQVNRSYALKLKEKYPEELKSFTFDDKFAINRSLGKEISFSMDHEAFKTAFVALFGGERGRG